MTHADIMASAMGLPPLAAAPDSVPSGTVCRHTGAALTEGYDASRLLSKTMIDGAAFCGGSLGGHLSESCGRVLLGKAPNGQGKMVSAVWNLGSRVMCESGAHFRPLVSPAAAAEQERIAWRDVIPEAWERHAGERCVIIAASDFKKQVWWYYGQGGAGALSRSTPCVLHLPEQGYSRLVRIDWPGAIECLRLVQEIRAAGFQSARDGVPWPLSSSLWADHRASSSLPHAAVAAWEADLARLRGTPELALAMFAESYSLKT